MTALIYAPFPDRESARAVAGTLLGDRLIACANLLGEVESLYEWNGEQGEGREIGVLFKTDGSLLERAVARIEALHPYDTPAVLGWKCDAAGAETAAWLRALKHRQ
ncbi:divalent-cation tolerance protein CutA [Erythrobacter sp. SDW2]|uniref:divalent-cation tolerance protein CutA n=1 Tax=Erythrobacter sp. SDW2 TaxID=2907154 RepID=UPI001F19D649|nr:divalent-cation tolerance protein CutA [Erythrobacter sp. SDW2]UIP07279.1 divalent-cation tolerance protein CutA [Erythrobacter sp. SDW2]